MSADEDRPSEFEQHARGLLDESVGRVNARVRSRLTQARHAALAQLHSPPRSFWRVPLFVPAAVAVAAAVVAVVLITRPGGERAHPGGEGGQGYEAIELLSDNDGLELVENFDGSFYEWAAAQGEEGDGGGSSG